MSEAGGATGAKGQVIACLDGSAYDNGVCDQAAWFASDPEVGVEVLHVRADAQPTASAGASRLVSRALRRLEEHGVGPLSHKAAAGAFVEQAARRPGRVLVVGKRGADGPDRPGRVGANVQALLSAARQPVCLASRVYLPIRRAVLLFHAAADLSNLAVAPQLHEVPLDAIVLNADAASHAAALAALRQAWPAIGQVRAVSGADPADVLAEQPREGAADLIILTRGVADHLFAAGSNLQWTRRSPVLVG